MEICSCELGLATVYVTEEWYAFVPAREPLRYFDPQGITTTGKRLHVCGVEASFSILVIAGCVAAPIIYYISFSDMRLILGIRYRLSMFCNVKKHLDAVDCGALAGKTLCATAIIRAVFYFRFLGIVALGS